MVLANYRATCLIIILMTSRSWILLLVGGGLFAVLVFLINRLGWPAWALVFPGLILVLFVISLFDDLSE